MYTRLACSIAITLSVSFAAGSDEPRQFDGRVVDEDGRPLAGATVRALRAGPDAKGLTEEGALRAAVTGATGRFELDPWPEATPVIIVATMDGRGLDWAHWRGTMAGETVLQLGSAATIEGTVVGDDAKPVSGARVDVLLRLEGERPRQMFFPLPGNALMASTDAQGRFRFSNIPEGAIVGFDMTAPGRARAFTDMRFAPGQVGLRFVMPREGRLEGTVVDKETGKPLADVLLRVTGSLTSGSQVVGAKTDKRGAFGVSGLSGGKYNIRIVGVGDALPQWLGSLEKVEVRTGELATAPKVEATKGGTLEVILTDADTGKPVAAKGFVQVARAEDLRIGAGGQAKRDGVARLYLAPGKYVVKGVQQLGYSCEPDPDKSFRVEVGATSRIKLPVTAMPQLGGIVRDRAGKPVPGAKVQVLPLVGSPKDLTADEAGRFAVDAADVGPWFCFLSFRHPERDLVALEALGLDKKQLGITLRPPARVSGKIVDSKGRPVGGARVQAQISASHLGRFAIVASTRTDEDGRYKMELAGNSISFAISVRAPGYGLAETITSQPQLVQGVAVHDFTLKAANREVRGVAWDPQGRPLAGVIVSASATGAGGVVRFPGSAVTNANGKFTMKHLTDEPTVRLSAKAPGRGWIGDGTIRPGQNEVVLRLGPSHYD